MHQIMLLSDGYKLSHHKMYPEGTTLVFSNLTPRSPKHAPQGTPVNGVIVMGVKKAIVDLDRVFKKWFDEPFDESVKDLFDTYLSTDYSIDHFRTLHQLGYLPIEIRAIDEGSFCPIGVPFFTIHNTRDEFFWLTNFLETYLSAHLWKATTAATIASGFYKNAAKYFKITDNTKDFGFNLHNFSARGMDSVTAMIQADLGHLLFFNGSDTLATMYALRDLYGVRQHMGNVPASEHSVMSAGTKENELETYAYMIKQFPKGYLSLVSDTWDLWNVLTNILPQLKSEIMGRDGKLIIRPDSGDPVDIICGIEQFGKDADKPNALSIQKGAVELLWDVFGGTINEQGFKVLDSHVGLIYGDAITVERQEAIYKRLIAKGFAVSNVVLGIGSYTYQYNTRDSYGMAVKATYTERKGKGYNITKDPITDDGTKKSATGLLAVVRERGVHGESIPILKQDVSWDELKSNSNILKPVLIDSVLLFEDSWDVIITRAKDNFKYLQFNE